LPSVRRVQLRKLIVTVVRSSELTGMPSGSQPINHVVTSYRDDYACPSDAIDELPSSVFLSTKDVA